VLVVPTTLSPAAQGNTDQSEELYGTANHTVSEAFSSIRVIHAYNMRDAMTGGWLQLFRSNGVSRLNARTYAYATNSCCALQASTASCWARPTRWHAGMHWSAAQRSATARCAHHIARLSCLNAAQHITCAAAARCLAQGRTEVHPARQQQLCPSFQCFSVCPLPLAYSLSCLACIRWSSGLAAWS
jgi:hypothetical protein